MEKHYTSEKNTQMLISLLKQHGVKKVVVSPGATNVCFVGSIQQDSYFEIYSSVDERSAAYIACGLSAESGEPVALSCTGATASRNYLPGLTEAYYRQLPIVAITSTQPTGRVGNYIPQVIDRSAKLNDIVKISVNIPSIVSLEDEWTNNVKLNRALLELTHRGGGPIHINLATSYDGDFSVKELPQARAIYRITHQSRFPLISNKNKIAIFVGTHTKWDKKLINAVDSFCERYNGVVLCDRIANYYGKYRINPCVVGGQIQYHSPLLECDLMIHIGSISGTDNNMGVKPKYVWRVNEDGEVRDTFRKLQFVFEMSELDFFNSYNDMADDTSSTEYYDAWVRECQRIMSKIPELPFSNAWVAQHTLSKLSEESIIHFGILNSLRSWSYFESDKAILGYSNTGGFGIDGGVSTLIGASLHDKSKIYYGIVGDLAFFYDMNAIGNRHISNNVRLMIINNGKGQEFRNPLHHAARFGEGADQFMAAAGHFGNKSNFLIRHYSEDLGYEYLTASNKHEFQKSVERFTYPEITDRPIIFEVFTESSNESIAFDIIHNLEVSKTDFVKKYAKEVLGDKGTKMIKKLIKS
ncbi:2-succinyl-5-enolpyruvyl-6-hydroxy-3-cyclohexene-1-carboxylate synthase [Faecalitalea cylindroides]|uniref:thiamine pyrophosphate-binding protein n=1 Tax=Faecalitalea cylindroides TaxID=39483 RepID=UPI00195810C6|nr:thiamine pyrophosphate-binding protein [Faecalitalea cylindroides]MBM6810017.1 2-succinyl-5-enolpyruvyl-6-hydroxy-3-cyclohexene-1-carboxylate synthase [Faecalitalea cylindroides]